MNSSAIEVKVTYPATDPNTGQEDVRITFVEPNAVMVIPGADREVTSQHTDEATGVITFRVGVREPRVTFGSMEGRSFGDVSKR